MQAIIGALLPVFGVVLLGFFLKRYGFPEATFWPQADRITYYVFFPSLLVNKLSTANLDRPELVPMTLILMVSIIIVSMLVALLRPFLKTSNATFTSLLQGSIRPNTYVGLAGANAIYGSEGLALAAIAIAGVIPLVNIISVFAFVQLIPTGKRGTKAVLINILRNPLIIACVVGLLLNFSGLVLPHSLAQTVEIVGRAALPLGLVSVGAGLIIQTLGSGLYPLLLSSFFKLLLLPLLVLGICIQFQIEGLARWVAVLYASLPCSVSSYTLAAQMGGDKEMVASIITIQTLLAMLTMTLIISLSGYLS